MQYAILQKGEVVGVADMDESYMAGEEVSLQEAHVSEDGTIDLFEECTEENHRACDITVAIGFAQDLARNAGVSSTEVDALEERGVFTEEEAKAAVCAVVARLPEDFRLEGETIVDVAWGQCGCDCQE